jgi:hypothetical protein
MAKGKTLARKIVEKKDDYSQDCLREFVKSACLDTMASAITNLVVFGEATPL